MQFTKIIRGIAAGALVLAALGAHAHTAQNTPLEKIDFQSAVCTLAQEAQVIDASEENAFLYGECASGTTINPYRYVDPDGRFAFVIPLVYAAYRAYSAYDTVSSAVENVQTLANSESTTGERAMAGAQLIGALIGGNAGKAGATAAIKGAEKIAEKEVAIGSKVATAAGNRAENVAKGIPESQLGPSGKPKIHVVEHATEKQAKDAARAEVGAGGSTVKHANPEVGGSHYHGTTQAGEKDRIHHEY